MGKRGNRGDLSTALGRPLSPQRNTFGPERGDRSPRSLALSDNGNSSEEMRLRSTAGIAPLSAEKAKEAERPALVVCAPLHGHSFFAITGAYSLLCIQKSCSALQLYNLNLSSGSSEKQSVDPGSPRSRKQPGSGAARPLKKTIHSKMAAMGSTVAKVRSQSRET